MVFLCASQDTTVHPDWGGCTLLFNELYRDSGVYFDMLLTATLLMTATLSSLDTDTKYRQIPQTISRSLFMCKRWHTLMADYWCHNGWDRLQPPAKCKSRRELRAPPHSPLRQPISQLSKIMSLSQQGEKKKLFKKRNSIFHFFVFHSLNGKLSR